MSCKMTDNRIASGVANVWQTGSFLLIFCPTSFEHSFRHLKTWVQSLGRKDPLEDGMATHSGILAWRVPTDRGAWRAAVHGVTETRLSD